MANEDVDSRAAARDRRARTPSSRWAALPIAGAGRLARTLAVAAPLALILASPVPAAALEQKLIAAGGGAGDQLGSSVAVDGDTAVVGAPNANAARGAVYVFARSGERWVQTAKLTASDAAAGDALGFSVAIDGDVIVAGAAGDDTDTNPDQGSAYTFAHKGAAARTQTAKLTASDAAAGDALGFSVAIDGDVIVAGAAGDDTGTNLNQGSAYTFARTGAMARIQTAKLTASDGGLGDQLGSSVAIDGDAIVAGAPTDSVGTNLGQGAAYTFARTGAARIETAKLTASDGAAGDALGSSVAIHGALIVAGAPSDDVGASPDQGSAYIFARTGVAARGQAAKLTASDGAAMDSLGYSVAIGLDAILAGSPFDDVGTNANQGSASIFFPQMPPPAPVPTQGPALRAGACANQRTGTPGPDVLTGTAAGDLLSGLAGDDVLLGLGGTDCLLGGTGNDRLSGGEEGDGLAGGGGNDRLGGDRGNDRLSGEAGTDRLNGGSGHDRLNGDAGNDGLSGEAGTDRLNGDGGNDRLGGGAGNDRLNGGSGHDRLNGGRGRNRYSAGAGNDSVNARNRRRERIDCGPGRDRATVDRSDRVRRCERVRRR